MGTVDLIPRRIGWFVSLVFLRYFVSGLTVGLCAATNAEEDEGFKGSTERSQAMTVISWCTCPVVYLCSMLGVRPGAAAMGIQFGWSRAAHRHSRETERWTMEAGEPDVSCYALTLRKD